MSAPLQGTASAATAISRVKYTHDAMIDLMIAKPDITQNQLAAHFGYTPPWVSRIVNSDAFQARLAQRKGDIVDPALTLSIEEKLKALADKSLNVILDKLTLSENPDLATKALELTTKALGYGARDRGATNVQNNFVVALPGKVADPTTWAEQYRPDLGAGTQQKGVLGAPAQAPVTIQSPDLLALVERVEGASE